MQKSKSKTSTALTPLETALQKQFKSDADRFDTLIREAYDRTTKIQSANIAAMVGFGFLALSIKPIVGHGKFGDWLSDTLGGQLSRSTAYTWMKAAEWLVKKVDNADKQTDIVSERICAFTECGKHKGLYRGSLLQRKTDSRFCRLCFARFAIQDVSQYPKNRQRGRNRSRR